MIDVFLRGKLAWRPQKQAFLKSSNFFFEFKALKRNYPRLMRRMNRSGVNKLSSAEFITRIDQLLQTDIKESLNFIRKSISSMKKTKLRKVEDDISEKLNPLDENFLYFQWYYAIMDNVDSKLFKERPPTKKK